MMGNEDGFESRESPAPPIPLRNPLRNKHYHQAEYAPRRENFDENIVLSSLATTETLLQELDHEFGASYANKDDTLTPLNKDITDEMKSNDFERGASEARHIVLEANDGDNLSTVGTSSSWAGGLRRYSAYLGMVKPSVSQNSDEKSNRQREIEYGMTRIRSKYEIPESLTTISGYDSAPSTLSNFEEEIEDPRVEAWLHRGMFVTPSAPLQKSPSNPDNRESTHAYTDLLFRTSKLLTIGRHDHASPLLPLSPWDNGGDAHGNLIPTNTPDHLASPSPTNSTILPLFIDCKSQNSNSSMPFLWGGGGSGWWTPLSEKEPLLKENPRTRSGPIHRSSPTPAVKAGVSAEEDDWSDESDQDALETLLHQPDQLAQFELDTEDQDRKIYDKHQNPSREACAISPSPGPERTESLVASRPTSSRHDISFIKANMRDPPSTYLNVAREYTGSSTSSLSRNARARKRWDTGPTSVPPTEPALPPPALPRSLPSSYQATEHVLRPGVYIKQVGRMPSYPASYNNDAWDLQSLQLGESVSVAGCERQRGQRESEKTRDLMRLTPREFEMSQRVAQTKFRPLCQDVMARYNAEISKLERALDLDEILSSQYLMQRDWNIDNKNKALSHSAETSGYVILEEEPRILEAMKTAEGFAIYHDMLHTTQPKMWQRLAHQHRFAAITPVPTQRPRRSSIDQARRLGGKLARLILAAPSDSEVKTYSSRKPPNSKPIRVAVGFPPVFISPVATSAFTETSRSGLWRTRSKKAKGKGVVVANRPKSADGVYVQDFAAPSNTGISGFTTSKYAKKNKQWTGTTLVSSSLRETQSSEQGADISNPMPCLSPTEPQKSSDIQEDSEGDSSVWPGSDSQGNWTAGRTGRYPGIRGGDGKVGKINKWRPKKLKHNPLRSVNYVAAMHALG
ncbi:hypothetical protein GQ44DRAFT_823566 [Phaeosphaeriaceae sp. PMI808]|nr:hypothetical protein GQ44DRAFT_823566 [Phaeosphaeriaceae sp. PMI808]